MLPPGHLRLSLLCLCLYLSNGRPLRDAVQLPVLPHLTRHRIALPFR